MGKEIGERVSGMVPDGFAAVSKFFVFRLDVWEGIFVYGGYLAIDHYPPDFHKGREEG